MQTKDFDYAEYLLAEVEKCEEKENEAFREIMKLVAPSNQDEAIRLWVMGVTAEFWKGYYRRAQSEKENA